jgi:adenosylcobinamide kinase / adenosylcobinamide-phosphate guanylyltransferase
MLTLILGGARSGKTRLAQQLAAPARRVCYVATCVPGDDPEMHQRIERHRADRPECWKVLEIPLALADAVEGAAPEADTIVVDCLTVCLGNLFWALRETPEGRVEDTVRGELARIAAASRHCHAILVSNELGCGTVSEHALTRGFRDMHGFLNQWAAAAADDVIFAVAGLPLYLKKRLQEEAR